MSFFVNVKRGATWVKVRCSGLEMANNLVEQWKVRGFEAYAEARAS